MNNPQGKSERLMSNTERMTKAEKMTKLEGNTKPSSFGILSSFFIRYSSFALALVSSILLVLSVRLPLWQMRLEAPQYRDEEALRVAVYPGKYGGDMREISVLDQYIGVHVPATLPQFKWLPFALMAAAALGFVAVLLKRSVKAPALIGVAGALTTALVIAAVQAQFQIHDIGHKRDHKTILVGIHDFTPPFLGTSKIAQFTVSSKFGSGAWLIGSALVLQLAAAWVCRKRFAGERREASLVTPSVRTETDGERSSNPPPHVGGYVKPSVVTL
jgi:hypothetical protein